MAMALDCELECQEAKGDRKTTARVTTYAPIEDEPRQSERIPIFVIILWYKYTHWPLFSASMNPDQKGKQVCGVLNKVRNQQIAQTERS